MFKSFVYLLQNNQINLQDKINRKVIQKKKKDWLPTLCWVLKFLSNSPSGLTRQMSRTGRGRGGNVEGGARKECSLHLENTSKLPANVQAVSNSRVGLYYFQAMLKKESIILNTSKQFQFARRKPELDVTDTQNQMFQFASFPLADNQGYFHVLWIFVFGDYFYILKEISPECSLEGLMLKLKLQYFGHLMRRVDPLEKTLMLGGVGGQEEKGMTEDEMVGWNHQLDGHGFE